MAADGAASLRADQKKAEELCIRLGRLLEESGLCDDEVVAPRCAVTYDNRVMVSLDLRPHACERDLKNLMSRLTGPRKPCARCQANFERQRERIAALYPRMVELLGREARIIYRYPQDAYPFRVMLAS
jgi:hypothetical protein